MFLGLDSWYQYIETVCTTFGRGTDSLRRLVLSTLTQYYNHIYLYIHTFALIDTLSKIMLMKA